LFTCMVGLNLVSIRFVYMYGRPKLSEYTVCLHENFIQYS